MIRKMEMPKHACNAGIQKAGIAERCDFARELGGPKAIRALPLIERLRVGAIIAGAAGNEKAAKKCEELAVKERKAKEKRLQEEMRTSERTKQAAKEHLLKILQSEDDANNVLAATEAFRKSQCLDEKEIEAAIRTAFEGAIKNKNYENADSLYRLFNTGTEVYSALSWCLEQIGLKQIHTYDDYTQLLRELIKPDLVKFLREKSDRVIDPYSKSGHEYLLVHVEDVLTRIIEAIVEAIAKIAVELNAESEFKKLPEAMVKMRVERSAIVDMALAKMRAERNVESTIRKKLPELLEGKSVADEQPKTPAKDAEPKKETPKYPRKSEYANEPPPGSLCSINGFMTDKNGKIKRDNEGRPYLKITGTSHGQSFPI